MEKGSKMNTITKYVIVALLPILITIFNANGMTCEKQCQEAKDFRECFRKCLLNKKYLTEKEAKQEWFRRYPCAPLEAFNCHYPYESSYAQGIKRDNVQRMKAND
jgi:hypothetical protein